MILILSQQQSEGSTCQVIDWLKKYNGRFTRINGEDLWNMQWKNIEQLVESINIVWYRRWTNIRSHLSEIKSTNLPITNSYLIGKHLRDEIYTLSNYFFSKLKEKQWLSSLEEVRLNKLEVLDIAKTAGISTPQTIITSNKKELIETFGKNQPFIWKNISNSPMLFEKHTSLTLLTKIVDLEKLPETFFPSLFQTCIEKIYELRIFFLYDDFYPMAIFSQSNDKTKVDFRNYKL